MASAATRRTRRTTPARAGRRPFPARALHLVDIENLAGTGLPAEWQVADVRRADAARVGIGSMDQVIIGCNHKALPAAGHGWPGARYLVRSGPDGADTELLAVIAGENIAARFTHVTIASGRWHLQLGSRRPGHHRLSGHHRHPHGRACQDAVSRCPAHHLPRRPGDRAYGADLGNAGCSMSGRMNWDRVNRGNRAWRKAQLSPPPPGPLSPQGVRDVC